MRNPTRTSSESGSVLSSVSSKFDVKIVIRLLVVSRVDDEVQRFFDPLAGALFAQVVEHEQVGLHDRPQHFDLRRSHDGVIGISNGLQQLRHITEQPRRALLLDGFPQQGDRDMRLPDAWRANEEEPFIDDGNES